MSFQNPNTIHLSVLAALSLFVLAGCERAGEQTTTLPSAPSFTLGSGAASTPLAIGGLDAVHVHTAFGDFRVELKVSDSADVRSSSGTIQPGGYNGWHSHPGLGIVGDCSGPVHCDLHHSPRCSAAGRCAGSRELSLARKTGAAGGASQRRLPPIPLRLLLTQERDELGIVADVAEERVVLE